MVIRYLVLMAILNYLCHTHRHSRELLRCLWPCLQEEIRAKLEQATWLKLVKLIELNIGHFDFCNKFLLPVIDRFEMSKSKVSEFTSSKFQTLVRDFVL